MTAQEWQVVDYIEGKGRIPYREWFQSLRDFKAQAVIDARLARLRLGNFGKCEPVGQGVFELKIYYGPGYRIYFGKSTSKIILLLCGGDKSTQKKDILTAYRYWRQFKEKHS